eukprot:GEZU01015277.1.p1 GENE.GEZU01015277.1~~GEZU01015277.1.p1  ORF type:complete len:199 (+),score=77.24 GEZU01015277.1:54-650(+)
MSEELKVIHLPLVEATAENIADYGLLIGTEVPNAGLEIPFYKGSVIEGRNFNFVCHGPPVVRTAKIMPREVTEASWLERHMNMTQLFVGLGCTPFIMVLGKPTQNYEKDNNIPDINNVTAFLIPAGHGVMIHKGTWHDFPMAVHEPITALTMNSAEVVEALASMKAPGEMNHGDVYKLDVKKRLGVQIFVDIPPKKIN